MILILELLVESLDQFKNLTNLLDFYRLLTIWLINL
nr:MAG TPA: hypothetical protein [Caudoviricetes sp.]